jgi:hypothetical protein
MSSITDLATILAGVAELWAIAVAWITYVMITRSENKRLFESLQSTVSGLCSELDLMKPWTGAGGEGYSKTIGVANCPSDWWQPSRIIYKFGYDTIRGLSSSPYVYYLGDLVNPFVRLSFSVSKLFQFYDEYRAYALSRLDFYEDGSSMSEVSQPDRQRYLKVIFNYNYRIHMDFIGGKDTADEDCLYKTYKVAVAALGDFSARLKPRALPWWFMLGHLIAVLSFCAGGYLVYALLSDMPCPLLRVR